MNTKEKKTSINLQYVKNQLIAYIGNKRRLLDLLLKAFTEIAEKGSIPLNKNGFFIDYFAGSGVVSRLAKELGYAVIANDWEYYAKIINKSFLENDADFLKQFTTEGGLANILKQLNRARQIPATDNRYISKYYCPDNDQTPNIEQERMFYTQTNGRLIDNIRQQIDVKYLDKKDRISKRKKDLLLALLLYQSSLRANTSGIFKGFHKGFGGSNGDALNRILGEVKLELPILSNQKNYCKVFQSNANHLAEKLKNKIKAEIVYLDPPYNQHQYGSNYHMLNTIARNDKPEISKKFFYRGKKMNKSGIRRDWIKTRSTYCYKQTAEQSFSHLIENINAKYLLVSYSTEGIIHFEKMLKILAKKGKLQIVTSSYTRFRGGKQSLKTKTKNIEFVLIVDTQQKTTAKDLNQVRQVLLLNNIENLCEETFPILRDDEQFIVKENKGKSCTKKQFPYQVEFKDYQMVFNLDQKLNIVKEDLAQVWALDFSKQQKFHQLLEQILLKNNGDEINLLVDIIEQDKCPNKNYFLMRIFKLYKKINSEKNSFLAKSLKRRIQNCLSSLQTTLNENWFKKELIENYREILIANK